MKNIAELDPNLKVDTAIEREGLCFLDAEQEPFQIYGVFREGDFLRRMPENIARSVSDGVYHLHTNTAGGRVRFITDSPYIAIKTEYVPGKMPHFALTGSAGFDMYEDKDGTSKYLGTFTPPFNVTDGYESVKDFEEAGEKIITLEMPLYSSVKKLYIGVKEGSLLKPAPEYRTTKPVVFYGSSITQGGCASKPGSSYQSILSRQLDFDYINLGFSGNAKGEDTMVDYIKGLDMSLFVMDYDHNAPSIEHLEATHDKMFRAIRAAQPDLPILILPRPKYFPNEVERKRAEIIYRTYLDAKAAGDENVYFITSRDLMNLVGDNGTVDNCHPTDSGFFSMACAIAPVIEKILSF